MTFDHKTYPIIIGATYIHEDGDEGEIVSADIYPSMNKAEIIINTNYKGRFYKLNYATFAFQWKLKNEITN
jgi:hypothetical protein